MTTRERVGISEYKTAAAPVVLVTYGLGSCLGITLYDPERRIGGLAHTLLPEPKAGMDTTRATKFVDLAIRLMLDELIALGASRDCLQAKIFGGANMFAAFQEAIGESIGQRNIKSARETFAELGLPVVAEDVGGNYGRTLVFSLESGKVTVKSVREGRQEEEY